MPDTIFEHIERIDISKQLVRRNVGEILATGDALANRFGAKLYGNGAEVATDSLAVTGYYIRPDGRSLLIPGSKSGNLVYVDLPQNCYRYDGAFALSLKISGGSAVQTLVIFDGRISLTTTDTIVDNERIIPSIEEIRAQMDAMEQAREDAITAASNANAKARAATTAANSATTAAGAANTAAREASTAANSATAAAGVANTAASGADASAGSADAAAAAARAQANDAHAAADRADASAGSANTAANAANSAASAAENAASAANTAAESANTATSTATGAASEANTAASNADSKASAANTAALTANNAADTATAAAAKIDGLTVSATGLAPGASPTAAVSETDGHKHIAFGIPRGEGNGTVTAVNGVEPDAGGNVPLTARDVGALPSGGTAADAERLGGKAPEYYARPVNLLDNGDFANVVNQRGEASYTAKGYTIDKWQIVGSGGTVAVADGCVAITRQADSGTFGLVQQLPSDVCAEGMAVTMAVCDQDSGAVCCATGVIPAIPPTENAVICRAEMNGHTVSLTRRTTGEVFCNMYVAAGATLRVRWAALYEGAYTVDTLPAYVPKGYMAELLACQRYFLPYKPGNTALSFPGWHYSTSLVRVALPLPIAMAISSDRVPTLPLETENLLILPIKKAPTSLSVRVIGPNMLMLELGVTGTQHDLCALRVNAPMMITAPD